MRKIQIDYFLSNFKAIVKKNEPIVTTIPNILRCKDWTVDKLVSDIGDRLFDVSFSKYKLFTSRDDIKPEKMTFSNFIKATLNDPGSYNIDGVDIRNIDTLMQDVILPNELKIIIEKLVAMDLWIGTQGYTSNLHFDAVENINLQIYGTKSFILYPPQISGFKCRSILSGTGHVSSYKTYENIAAESEKCVNLERCQHIILNAGEMLYLPFSWWHEVRPLSDITINLNYFWQAHKIKYIQHPYQTASALITMLKRRIQNKPIA